MSDDAFSLGITRVLPESACSVIVAMPPMPPFLSRPTLPLAFVYLFIYAFCLSSVAFRRCIAH